MRLYVASQLTLTRAIQEIAALTITHPVEIVVKRAERSLTDPQRAVLHSMIRDLTRHAVAQGIPATEESVKEEIKRGMVPGIDWPGEHKQGVSGGEVWVPKGTMELTKREVADLIDQIGAFGSDHGVEWSKVDNWTEVA